MPNKHTTAVEFKVFAHFPNPDRLVPAARRQELSVGGPRDTLDLVLVAFQLGHHLELRRAHVPNTRCTIEARGCEKHSRRVPGDTPNGALVRPRQSALYASEYRF